MSPSLHHPRSETLVGQLEHQFESTPDRVVAVFLEDGDHESARLTARQLQCRAKAIAAILQRDARPGARALLLYPSGPDFVTAYLGCLYAGVIPAPCYPPPRNRADARIASIGANAEPQFILASDKVVLGAGPLEVPGARQALTLCPAMCSDEAAALWQPPAIDGGSIGLLQYTSGSTADPRGVMVSHANLLANLEDLNRQLQHDASSVIVTWLPVHHDMGLIYGVLQPLVYGFLSVMMPPAAFLQSPVRWLRAFTTYRGTHSTAPNFAYDLCVRRVNDEAKAPLDLSSWCVAVNGAEPVNADTLARFSTAFASCGFQPRTFSPAFGLAESTLMVTITRRGEMPVVLHGDPAELARGRFVAAENGHGQPLVGCGVPVPETVVRIVSPESRVPCAPGEVGEIWVDGPIVARGYWANDVDSAGTFGAQIAGEPGTFLRTGDLGFLHQNALFVTGRAKDVVIHHGLNYYPQDIERTVEASHPAIAAAGSAAFGVQEDGVERLVVVAEIQRTARRHLDLPEVIGTVRQRVAAEHGFSPSHIVLLQPRTLPKTSSGKVRRGGCRALFLANELAAIASWSDEGPGADKREAIGRPSTREWLIDRFAMRLRVPAASIDTRAPLADLGLDSLAATEIAGELQQWLGRPVSATALYDYPTVDALVRHLDGQQIETAPPRGPATDTTAIAIVGMGCRFPGARNVDEFWALLRDGVDAIRETPPTRWPSSVARFGGFVDDVDRFDAEFFGIAPREAERMDPQQRLLLEVAWESLEHASIRPDRLAGTRTGVFTGIANSDYARMLIANGATQDPYLGTGSALSIAANRLSYLLDLRGPSLAIDTACSSSLVAVALACQSLRRGECDLALAGGVNLVLSPEYTLAFAAAGMMSAEGRCKTFDGAADGYVRGEGAGLVVLKRLDEAERDGDLILAVLRGVAVNQDGRTSGLTAPNGPAQSAVIRAALDDAHIAPAQVTYIEAHGTGTALGDPIEVNSLASVLREGRDPDAICHVGSVKTNIGHLEAAAGIAGVIKATLAIVHREIPASLHCDNLNPLITLDGTPLRIATSRHEWSSGPRIAGVSSFGFGGTNAHVILQEHAKVAPRSHVADGPCVLTVSAKSRGALAAAVDRYVATLRADEASFADVCFSAAVGRTPFPYRVTIVAETADEAAEALTRALNDYDESRRPAPASGVAFLFTGHGAEYPGMGAELYDHEPAFRNCLDECAAIVRPMLGGSLADLLYGPSPAPLDNLAFAQPAIVAVEIALARLWAEWGVRPAAVIGHSLGELAAAHVAGVMTLEDTMMLVAERGRLLQSIAGDGSMAAAMAPVASVETAIDACSASVSVAATNGAANTVFSGRQTDVTAVVEHLRSQGVRCSMLPIGHAFHSRLVDQLLAPFEAAAARARMHPPRVPFVSNVTGQWHEAALDAVYWRRHLREPVRFAEGLETLRTNGHRLHLEIGGHRLLASIGAEADRDPDSVWASSLVRNHNARRAMRQAAADLWAHGVEIEWRALCGPGVRKTTAPTYQFQRQRYWLPASAATAVSGEPMALRRVHVADTGGRRVFETTLSAAAIENLQGGHRIGNMQVASAALLIELARTAAGLTPPAACEDFEVSHPLAVNGQPRIVQVVLDPIDHGTRFGIFSRTSDEEFQRHATGYMRIAESAATGAPTAAVTSDRIDGSRFDTVAPAPSSLYTIDWTLTDGPLARGRRSSWLLLADRTGVADAIATAFHQRADRCVVMPAPADRDHDRLFAAAADALGGDPEGVVHLCGVGSDAGVSAAALDEATMRGAQSALQTMQALIRRRSGAKLWIVTRGPLQGAVHGLAATLALEHPRHWGAHIQLDGGAELASAIVAEAAADGADDHVRLAPARRQVARLKRVAERLSPAPVIHPDATYLITGGLGTIGLAVARALADRGAGHLVLLSRRGADTQDKQEAVDQLRGRGVTVTTPAIDLGDVAALRAVASQVEAPIRGIVHAAGTASFTLLSEATFGDFAGAVRAKPIAAVTLAELAPAADFFVSVSSMIGAWGAEGQGLYAASNALVDALAADRVLPMTSIALGPVRGGMLPPALASAMERMGVSVWTPERAAAAILDLAAAPARHVIAADIDWGRYKPLIESRGRRPFFDGIETPIDRAATTALRERLRAASAGERGRLLTQLVLDAAAAALGMRPEAWVDLDRGFFEMGMDSIAALDLRTRLERSLAATFPPTLIFNHPNVNALTIAVADLVEEPAAAAATAEPTSPLAAVNGTSADKGHVPDAGRQSGELDPQETAAVIAARLEQLERLVARS